MTTWTTYRTDCSDLLDIIWGKIQESDLDHVFLRLQTLDNIHEISSEGEKGNQLNHMLSLLHRSQAGGNQRAQVK